MIDWHSLFPDFPKNARVWTFAANRELSAVEVRRIEEVFTAFLGQWKAHGQELRSQHMLIMNRFVVIVVDEHTQNATGCSIDAATRQMQALGAELDVDFLDRMQVVYQQPNGQIVSDRLPKIRSMVKEGQIDPTSTVFNLMPDRLDKWIADFARPLNQSFLAELLPEDQL